MNNNNSESEKGLMGGKDGFSVNEIFSPPSGRSRRGGGRGDVPPRKKEKKTAIQQLTFSHKTLGGKECG